MENKIYNDDVERIVNEPERQEAINAFHEKRQAKRQRKMLVNALFYAGIAVSFGLLGCIEWLYVGVAFPMFAILAIYSAFCFGRWFENGKCWGWH